MNVETEVGIGGTIDTEAQKVLSLLGFMTGGFKYIVNGVEHPKDTTIKTIAPTHETTIVAVEGLGPMSTYRRFKVDNTLGSWWGNSGSSPDGLRWKCKQSMKVAGFAAFASQSGETYEIKWEVKVNDSLMTQGHQKNAEITDKYYVKIFFDELVDVPANSPLDITVWIA